jgi:HrpA-like RNA helicase
MSKGILDPNSKNMNLITNRAYSNSYKNTNKWWFTLPVYKDAAKIVDLIQNNQVLLVISGTGSGKSTLIPFFALHTLGYQGKIVMTIPKRGAVLSAASTTAKIGDAELGQEVGYQFRGSKLPDGRPSKSKDTKILISTDGSIVAQLINDPELKSYDIVIIDEAHERGIQIDLLLLLMKKALKLNPKLKLIIMSATINPEIFANYFKKEFSYSEVNVAGSSNFPVENIHLDQPLKNPEKDFIDIGVSKIVDLLEKTDDGAILFFVNSLADAKNGCQKLSVELKNRNIEKPFCIEVSGEIAKDKELLEYIKSANKFKNHPNGPFNRKVVIATNSVESSITIDGLEYVIDSGYAYVDSYDANKMERRLLQERISKAQAVQRSGRVGRNKPGTCYRLYTEKEFKEFIDYPVVDIRKSDLTDEFLKFMTLPYVKNISDLLKLLKELIEPPSDIFIKSALYRLYALGAIDKMNAEGQLTDLGEKLSKFRKLDPIMAKIVIESFNHRVEYDTITLAAMITRADGRMNTFIKDMKNRRPKSGDKDYNRKDREYRQEKARYDRAIKTYTSAYGDIMTLLKLYKQFREYSDTNDTASSKLWCNERYLKYERLKDIKRNSQEIMREVKEIVFKNPQNSSEKVEILEHIYSKEDENDIVPANVIKNSAQNGGYEFKIKGGMTVTEESTLIQVLLHGLFINTAKMVGFNKYKNCFPFDKSFAGISQDSLLTIDKSGPKYILYMELVNILGRQKYNLTTKIPETTLRKLDDKQKSMISPCFKIETIENRSHYNVKNRSHKSGKSPKKGKPSKKGKSPKQGKRRL